MIKIGGDKMTERQLYKVLEKYHEDNGSYALWNLTSEIIFKARMKEQKNLERELNKGTKQLLTKRGSMVVG